MDNNSDYVSTLLQKHQQMRTDFDESIVSSAAIIESLDETLKKLRLMVLREEHQSEDFHLLADYFLHQSMLLADRNLTVEYVRLALTAWDLPFNPSKMSNFKRFQEKYGNLVHEKYGNNLSDDPYRFPVGQDKFLKYLSTVIWCIVLGGLVFAISG